MSDLEQRGAHYAANEAFRLYADNKEPTVEDICRAINSAFTIGFAAGHAEALRHPHSRRKK